MGDKDYKRKGDTFGYSTIILDCVYIPNQKKIFHPFLNYGILKKNISIDRNTKLLKPLVTKIQS